MEDKRKHPRVPVRAQIQYKVIPVGKAKEFSTKDMSPGGLRFLVHEHIPIDSNLKIRLVLPGQSFSFEAIAKVKWIQRLPSGGGEGYEVGVGFVDVSKEAMEHLGKNTSICDTMNLDGIKME